MDISLFSTLLRNLLHANVMHISNSKTDLCTFEENYCFHPSLQPMFTAESLAYLTESMHEYVFYEITDRLGVCLVFFRFQSQTFFIGPYVRHEYEEEKMQAILVENQMPASYKLSLRLYFSAFPLLSSFQIQNTVTACVNAFTGGSVEFSYHRLRGFTEQLNAGALFDADPLDYDEVYRRYDAENYFLEMIETGNTETVLTAYADLILPGSSHKLIDSAIYQNPIISLSILRALARKAAENGGAPIVEINEITQRTVQKMTASQNLADQLNLTRSMISELTGAVRRHRLRFGMYSAPIQKVLEYLELNYSQEISFSHLAELAHFSESHLSKTFKKETGVTVTRYIMQTRCKKAAGLLRDTDLTVQEISNYVGYPDNNYFVKIFKKQYGATPTAFRATQKT